SIFACFKTNTSLPPPALRERCHGRLAVRGVAVGRRAVLVVPEGQCPHPRRADRHRTGLEDAADNLAIGEHVVIIVTPLSGRTRGRCAFEGEVVLVHSRGIQLVAELQASFLPGAPPVPPEGPGACS